MDPLLRPQSSYFSNNLPQITRSTFNKYKNFATLYRYFIFISHSSTGEGVIKHIIAITNVFITRMNYVILIQH